HRRGGRKAPRPARLARGGPCRPESERGSAIILVLFDQGRNCGGAVGGAAQRAVRARVTFSGSQGMPSIVVRKSLIAPRGPFIVEPESVRIAAHRQPPAADDFTLEMVPRNCRLERYSAVDVPSFTVDEEIIAYCSPESTYAVTKRL